MAEYRTSGHAIWDIKYHLVWITKYRYKLLRGEVAERARDVIRQICESGEVRIVRGAISPDHVHMLVSSPPQLAGEAHQRAVVTAVAGRVSASAEALLGPASVGAGLFLRDGGRGGREDDPGVHREPGMGRR